MLNITDTYFTDNWQPVAVTCMGSSNARSSVDITSSNCSVTTTSTTFSENRGGALVLSSVPTTLVHQSTFTSNSVGELTDTSVISPGGGGISSQNCRQTVISNSSFDSNVAVYDGGAVFAYSAHNDSSLHILGCDFQSDKALLGSGGAIYVSGVSDFNVDSSNFTSCSAAVAGGSVFAVDAPTGGISLTLCTFVNSSAGTLPLDMGAQSDTHTEPQSGDAPSQPPSQIQGGGGVFISNRRIFLVNICVFENCSAFRSKGGGLRIRAVRRGIIVSSNFSGCSAAAAGAIAINSMLQGFNVRTGLISNSFINNTASTQLACPSDTCVPLDATLVGTQGDGGAVAMDGCYLILYDVNSFVSNFAAGRGGALFAQRPSDVSALQLAGDAGELNNYTAPGGLPYRFHTSFINNSALIAGGALALHGYAFDLGAPITEIPDAPLYTLFYGNVAPTGEDNFAKSCTNVELTCCSITVRTKHWSLWLTCQREPHTEAQFTPTCYNVKQILWMISNRKAASDDTRSQTEARAADVQHKSLGKGSQQSNTKSGGSQKENI